MINGGNILQLKGLDYEDMTGTYKCIVTGIGGQSSGTGTFHVYCKYYTENFSTKINYRQNLKHLQQYPIHNTFLWLISHFEI